MTCYIKNQLSNKSITQGQTFTVNVFGEPHQFQVVTVFPVPKEGEQVKVGAKTVIDLVDNKSPIDSPSATVESVTLFGLDEELK